MVHATWGDWFVSEVESADVDGVAVWYLGCNGFVLRSATTTLYVDPYFGDGDPPATVRMIPVPMDPADATRCDGVFVTHEHIDHMHPPSFDPLLRDGGTLHAPSASYTDMDYEGDVETPADQRRVVEAGDAVEVGDFTVHVRGAHDPDALEPVTYVVEHEAGTFFHGGDTKPSDDFAAIGAEFNVDLGVLAFGSSGTIGFPEGAETVHWYMDEGQVVETANALRVDRLLPSHWDMWRGVTGDPKSVAEHATTFEYPRVLETVKIGDRVDLSSPGVVRSASLR